MGRQAKIGGDRLNLSMSPQTKARLEELGVGFESDSASETIRRLVTLFHYQATKSCDPQGRVFFYDPQEKRPEEIPLFDAAAVRAASDKRLVRKGTTVTATEVPTAR